MLIFSIFNHPCSFKGLLLLYLWCFSILVNYYFQLSFNLKVIFHVAKITRNTATLLLYVNPSHDIFRSLPSSEILGGSKNSQSQDVKVPHVDFTRIFILHEIIHATHMVIGLSAEDWIPYLTLSFRGITSKIRPI